ncbi:hypothetical protein A2U01_0099153, partial [Trifolium medium]|nr:hypothetical protein [Trifolium medium]
AIPVVSTTSTASKPKGSSTSTASDAPARNAQTTTPGRTLPNTGAKVSNSLPLVIPFLP